MDDSKTIYTNDGISIPYLEKKAENFLDKTTFIFGGTGSGKTTIIEEIMWMCKDKIPNYIVIVPQTSAELYRKKLPDRCIKDDLTKKMLIKIWNRQTDMTKCYNIAKDPKVLESLFNKVGNKQANLMIQAVNISANSHIDKIRRRTDLNFAQKRAQETAIEVSRSEAIRQIYKDTIRDNKDLLMKKNLSMMEETAVEYLDVNPRIMLIIDDCSEKIASWMGFFKKGEVNIFESILFRGRWNYITMVFVSHDDKLIKPELRKGARVTIFTTSQSLIASLQKPQSGYTNQEKKEGMKIAGKLFAGEENGVKTYQKLCYIREDPKPFKYTIANLYPDFELGCGPLKELAEKLPKKEDRLEDNKFIKDILERKKKKKEAY
jgi:hypothetical protein